LELNQKLVGAPVGKLIAIKGHPDNSYTLSNKHTVYSYSEKKKSDYIGFGIGNGAYWGGGYMGISMHQNYEIPHECKLFFEIDDNEKVVDFSYRGDRCVAR